MLSCTKQIILLYKRMHSFVQGCTNLSSDILKSKPEFCSTPGVIQKMLQRIF